MPAPPSGQKVRLRRGKAPSEGYLQMFRDNRWSQRRTTRRLILKRRWGYVCDAGTWGVEEAEVICKQLGFSRGVQKTTQGLVHGKVEHMSMRKIMTLQRWRRAYGQLSELCALGGNVLLRNVILRGWEREAVVSWRRT